MPLWWLKLWVDEWASETDRIREGEREVVSEATWVSPRLSALTPFALSFSVSLSTHTHTTRMTFLQRVCVINSGDIRVVCYCLLWLSWTGNTVWAAGRRFRAPHRGCFVFVRLSVCLRLCVYVCVRVCLCECMSIYRQELCSHFLPVMRCLFKQRKRLRKVQRFTAVLVKFVQIF